MLIAKFKCLSITPITANGEPREGVTLSAVTNEEPVNQEWSKYTPSGQLTLSISNPAAQGKFVVGQEYLITIAPAVAGE